MISVTLYSKRDCHLCEQARADLDSLHMLIPHQLVIVDIDSDEKIKSKYGDEVPVVEIGPYRLKAPFSRQELQVTLGAARDRERHIEMIDASQGLDVSRQGGIWTKADSFSLWIARHYLAALNVFILIYLGLPFLAPVLMKIDWVKPANLIYRG